MSKTYNGWKNYETWAVNLWLENEEPSYRYWRETAQEVLDDATPKYRTRKEQAAFDLADRLKSELEEAMPEVEGLWADLLGAAFQEVNWHEIAEHYVDDLTPSDSEAEA